MTAVKDSVHGYIELDPAAEQLLDTPAMQRLRYIRQLSTVQFVYPSANHTRFEHSLGVYHLASEALSQLAVDDQLAKRLRIAALLHDVGHGPFGHQTEPAIERHLGRHHDEVRPLLTNGAIAEQLRAVDLSPTAVAESIDGDGPLGTLISSAIDVDRMDYLVRDAHHTGVPYGTIDHDRLVRSMRIVDGELVIGGESKLNAESALIARTLMNAAVYRHHVSRIAGTMLDRASERLLADDVVAPETFGRLTDHELLDRLLGYDHTAMLAERIKHRNLYKRAIWAPRGTVSESLVGLDYEQTRELERAVADRADIAPVEVMIDSPGVPRSPEAAARIVVNGNVQSLRDTSELVSGLEAFSAELWRLGVYTPPKHRSAVKQAAQAVLGLESTSTITP